MADLVVAPGVVVPEEAIAIQSARASGPGGQNVNKVASKVTLRVAVDQIVGLTAGARARLEAAAGSRWVEGPALLISASESRSQLENRQKAETKLLALLRLAIVPPRIRRATRPTLASKERRLQSKVSRSRIKWGRGPYRDPD